MERKKAEVYIFDINLIIITDICSNKTNKDKQKIDSNMCIKEETLTIV